MPNDKTTQRLTPKQERFAQAYLTASSAADAYRKAYNTENMRANAVYIEAHKLLKNPKVAARIDALKANQQRRMAIDRDRLTEMLWEAHDMAKEQGNSQAMIAAADKLARLWGEMVERHETRDITDQHTEAIREFARKKREQSNTNDRLH